MEKEIFLQKVKEQFLDDDQPKVTFDGKFRELPTWDSLTGMAILTIIEDEFGVVIPVEDFKKLENIAAIYEWVKKNKS